jgi:hypothetical protein
MPDEDRDSVGFVSARWCELGEVNLVLQQVDPVFSCD